MTTEYARLDAIVPRSLLMNLRTHAATAGRSVNDAVTAILTRHLVAPSSQLTFNPEQCDYVVFDPDRLPTHGGIYFVVDDHNHVLYVGKAVNLRSRWKNHRLRSDLIRHCWDLYFKALDATRFPTLDAEEAAWIASLSPPLNKQRPTGLRGVQ